MTLTKESLREALVEFDAWEDGSVNSLNDLPLVQAARFVERLLPGKCDGAAHSISRDAQCPTCHDTGQIWDEGLVEVVAKALYYLRQATPWDVLPEAEKTLWKEQARTVLSALAGEVGRG